MPTEIESRPEPASDRGMLIFRLVRLTVGYTVASGAVLLIMDFIRARDETPRFLTETVIQAFVYGTAAQVVVAIAAITSIALWKK